MPYPLQHPINHLQYSALLPHIVEAILLDHLRQHFSDPAVIERPPLQADLWRSDLQRQGILIELLDRWLPAQAGLRPALLTRRMPYQPFPLGIDNRHMGGMSTDGAEHFTAGVRGAITIFCIAAESGACELLAAEVFTQLLGFGSKLRCLTPNMLRCGVSDVGIMQPVAESRGHFGIPVTFAFAHTYSWSVTQAGRVLRHIDTSGLRA